MRLERTALLLGLLAMACRSGGAIPGTTVRMSFDRADGFYTAPFPSNDLRRGDAIDVTGFPNPSDVGISPARGGRDHFSHLSSGSGVLWVL